MHKKNHPAPKPVKKSGKKASTSTPPPAPIRFSFKPRNETQRSYTQAIRDNDLTFGLGPAGTGKTFLAVAMAVESYLAGSVSNIILVRPAVEAGERLGFLPGSLQEKVDPYLRPFYDALNELLPPQKVLQMMEDKTIEVAPLAFMRGRTLKNAFIICDEAQNTTQEQMFMFLTRFGPGSKAVVTGDQTQVDLANPSKSGLLEAVRILRKTRKIGMHTFYQEDVVRHQMVQDIVEAYENDKNDKK